jgi:hypothetical protein
MERNEMGGNPHAISGYSPLSDREAKNKKERKLNESNLRIKNKKYGR